jgi:lysophospholipase L1-like esterase
VTTDGNGDLRDVRVCFFGDSFTAGVGDPKALGWVGRVAARTPPSTGVDLTAYPLGVRGESTEEIVVRMPLESASRFSRGDEHRVVIAPGIADAARDVNPARSAAALGFGLEAAGVPALVIGPPPVGDDAMRERLDALDAAFANLCTSRNVTYIATLGPLAGREPWHEARADDGMHPDQTGYGLLAYVILNGGWYDWLGATPPQTPIKRRGHAS